MVRNSWMRQTLRRFFLIGLVLMVMTSLMPLRCFADDSITPLEIQTLGTKYPNEPMNTRISRLEKVFHLPPLPKASISFRLTRLYELQRLQVSEKNQQDAIRAYNSAIDNTAQDQYEKAIQDYQKAIRYNTGFIQAYNNLGHLLEELQKYDDAIRVYQDAIRQAPNNPLLQRNVGVLYEKVGNVPEALAHYRQYIALTQQPDASIVNIVNYYDNQHKIGEQSDNYVAFAHQGTHGQNLLWPQSLNPIPVYINIAPDQTPFVPVIEESLKAWETASKGRIQFREVGNPERARITINLKAGPLAHPDMEVGQATYNLPDNQGLKVSITVNTGERDAPISLKDRLLQVNRLALHEIGHAIGIWGHSPDPNDIMFSHPIVSKLSQRDITTIQRLYGVYSGKPLEAAHSNQ